MKIEFVRCWMSVTCFLVYKICSCFSHGTNYSKISEVCNVFWNRHLSKILVSFMCDWVTSFMLVHNKNFFGQLCCISERDNCEKSAKMFNGFPEVYAYIETAKCSSQNRSLLHKATSIHLLCLLLGPGMFVVIDTFWSALWGFCDSDYKKVECFARLNPKFRPGQMNDRQCVTNNKCFVLLSGCK